MVFTTQIFLFLFFPLCLACYYLVCFAEKNQRLLKFCHHLRLKELILIGFSFGFYMWACFDDLFKLILYIAVVYCIGFTVKSLKSKKYFLRIEQESNSSDVSTYKKIYLCIIPLSIGIILLIMILGYYKYYDFFITIWNTFTQSAISSKSILAPLGISFITFSAISYITDIYRGTADGGSMIDCALYLSFFPKVISGPIVLWKNFQPQIHTKHLTLEQFMNGLNRIMIGFGKKVLLADTFGKCQAGIGLWGIDQITAAGSILLYMLQIYYDFSGYSDIAIGISNLFGFDFQKNFDFPYRSKSITEFWRRWHISLGAWFREYVYFPLGGNRKGLKRTLINLAIVFVLTGIWHGAGWNYILWGAINGGCILLERIIKEKPFYVKTPDIFKYTVTMFIVMLFWQLFKYQSLGDIVTLFGIITGTVQFETIYYTWQYHFSNSVICYSVIGILGATLSGSPKLKIWYSRLSATKMGFILQEVLLLGIFILSILYMVNSTYSPFIYFQY